MSLLVVETATTTSPPHSAPPHRPSARAHFIFFFVFVGIVLIKKSVHLLSFLSHLVTSPCVLSVPAVLTLYLDTVSARFL